MISLSKLFDKFIFKKSKLLNEYFPSLFKLNSLGAKLELIFKSDK